MLLPAGQWALAHRVSGKLRGEAKPARAHPWIADHEMSWGRGLFGLRGPAASHQLHPAFHKPKIATQSCLNCWSPALGCSSKPSETIPTALRRRATRTSSRKVRGKGISSRHEKRLGPIPLLLPSNPAPSIIKRTDSATCETHYKKGFPSALRACRGRAAASALRNMVLFMLLSPPLVVDWGKSNGGILVNALTVNISATETLLEEQAMCPFLIAIVYEQALLAPLRATARLAPYCTLCPPDPAE